MKTGRDFLSYIYFPMLDVVAPTGDSLLRAYTCIDLPADDLTGTQTRRKHIRTLSPLELLTLNNYLVEQIIATWRINEQQKLCLDSIRYILTHDDKKSYSTLVPLGISICIPHWFWVIEYPGNGSTRLIYGFRRVMVLHLDNWGTTPLPDSLSPSVFVR